jgi:hypothetical protein
MIIEHSEKTGIDFDGTIIDIESIGEFSRDYQDSRHYKDIKQVILGYITREKLHIYCATSLEEVEELRKLTPRIFQTLARPYYSFNCNFDSGVLYHHIGIQIDFEGELQNVEFERKKDAILSLRIPNYDDPFSITAFYASRPGTPKTLRRPSPTIAPACLRKEISWSNAGIPNRIKSDSCLTKRGRDKGEG